MPLHIDVRINETLINRLHIARMTHNGMRSDSVNEYSVVIAEKKIGFNEDYTSFKTYKDCPDSWEWDASDIRFNHCYGDDELTLLMKALEAVKLHQAESN